jgi:tRNA threonylcarbamoyladenosine biosynthesis protein TsaB
MRSSPESAVVTPASPLRSVLAFDTSTDRMSLALAVDDRVWMHEGPGGAQASAALVPALLGLLAEAGQTLAGLQAIAFGRGPGAFTGLRTACSVAQGLAFGAGLPVLPIDTLMSVAEDARTVDAACIDVWAALDARMDEVYAAHYRFNSDAWHVVSAPALYTLDALTTAWAARTPIAVAGNAIGAFGDRLQAGDAVLHPAARPQATAMLALARRAWAAREAVDAAGALPLYLRDKVALTTVERAEVKAAKLSAASLVHSSSASTPPAGAATIEHDPQPLDASRITS